MPAAMVAKLSRYKLQNIRTPPSGQKSLDEDVHEQKST
jgi:hypothetical protein